MIFDIQFQVNIPLAIFIGITSAVLLNLGKGVQRMGAETLGKDILKKWKQSPEERKKIQLWLLGTLMTTLAAVLGVVAQAFSDRSSTIVALSGVGILAVVIFSIFTLKEKLNRLQIVGITLIIVGTFLIGFGYQTVEDLNPNAGFWIYALIFAAIGISISIMSIKMKKGYGLVFGIISGISNGFSTIFTQFSVSTGGRELMGLILNWWLVVSILGGQGGFWFTQYAFKKGGKASIVVPSMSALMIIIPTVMDILIYNAPMSVFQFLAFALNLGGVVLLSMSSERVLNTIMGATATEEVQEDG
ncbi:MAG: EamA family transporter [Candidatus Hodarchaeota archaeon]